MKKFKHFVEEEFSDCRHLFAFLGKAEREGKWIFRGQSNYFWGLQTSIERMFEEGGQTKEYSNLNIEIALIKRFQRESHHYGIQNNDYLNIPEWLSLMQHYGAPTRLLDWTHSPWVGLFFALANLPKNTGQNESEAALWLIDWTTVEKNTNPILTKLYKRDHNLILIDDFIKTIESGDGIVKLNSFKQNQRQIIQQGTFLFPLNINKTFEENLITKFSKRALIKVRLKYNLKAEVLKRLYRMNITFATLYPGIEGFSKSLASLQYVDGIFKLEENIKDYKGYKRKFKKNAS